MPYKKVFSTTRFHARSQNNFKIDSKNKTVSVGNRNTNAARSVLLGKIYEQGKAGSVLDYGVMCDVGFPHVIGIFGSRGSGKSFDLGVLIEGLAGLDSSDIEVSEAAIIFDVQDQFWTLGYEPNPNLVSDSDQLTELARWGISTGHVQNLQVLVPAGSDTQVPNAIEFSLGADQISAADWLVILELERFSPMGQALITLLGSSGSLPPLDLARSCRSDPSLINFQQGTIEGLVWRLESLGSTKVISDNGIPIDDLLLPGRFSVILMRNLSDSIRSLIVGVLARLASDRMGRVQQERKVADRTGVLKSEVGALTNRLWLFLDEAHVLVPSDAKTAATDPLVDYVKRGRDAGLSLVFATQQPSAVDSRLMSQVDLTLTHMLGFEADLNAATARMPTRTNVDYDVDNEKTSSLTDVVRSLGPGEAMLADNLSGRVFVVRVRPRMSAHGGNTPK